MGAAIGAALVDAIAPSVAVRAATWSKVVAMDCLRAPEDPENRREPKPPVALNCVACEAGRVVEAVGLEGFEGERVGAD